MRCRLRTWTDSKLRDLRGTKVPASWSCAACYCILCMSTYDDRLGKDTNDWRPLAVR
jgi:hypothetical protein